MAIILSSHAGLWGLCVCVHVFVVFDLKTTCPFGGNALIHSRNNYLPALYNKGTGFYLFELEVLLEHI